MNSNHTHHCIAVLPVCVTADGFRFRERMDRLLSSN